MPHPRLLCLGDNVVDRYVDTGLMFPGGNALNVAVHARRLGIASAYLGVVGTDKAGEVVRQALLDEDVDTSRVAVVDGPNAYADVRVVDGNRTFGEADPGVSRFVLTAEQVSDAAGFDLVHTGDCSMTEAQLPALNAVAQRLSFDFSEKPWDYVASIAPLVDIAIASQPQASTDDVVDHARRIAALGPSVVAVTRGANGAALLHHGEVTHGAPGDGPVIDTLGAGDAFIARLLVGILNREDPTTCLTSATAYATAACAAYGAFGHPGVPYLPLSQAATQTL